MSCRNIAIFSLSDSLGGSEQLLKMLCHYYDDKGDYVDIFFLTRRSYGLWDDCSKSSHLYFTTRKNYKSGFFELVFNILNANKKYDYAWTSHIYLNSFIGILRWLHILHTKYLIGRDSRIYTNADNKLKQFIWTKILLKTGYSSLDLLISQTDEMRQAVVRLNQKLESKIQVIPNPVDIKMMQEKAAEHLPEQYIREQLIVAAGRLIKIKGFDVLIRAFKHLNNKRFKLVILGEGEEKENLTKLINLLELTGQVELYGYCYNVYPWFRHAQACVVSSLHEGFPNVLLQMMSQNTKIVSTLCTDSIKNINGIFTCETNDIEDLAYAIECCLADTSPLPIQFNDLLKKRTVENFVNQCQNYLSL
jgi:glycosyltransferase involved in cell wall biosynthesis